jgi:hypothetical protein
MRIAPPAPLSLSAGGVVVPADHTHGRGEGFCSAGVHQPACLRLNGGLIGIPRDLNPRRSALFEGIYHEIAASEMDLAMPPI